MSLASACLRPAHLAVLALLLAAPACLGDPSIHDRSRPQPQIVDPGSASSQEAPGRPPSDAIVLFDGSDLSRWTNQARNGPAPWRVGDGWFEVASGTGVIQTAQAFGSCQLHLEWSSPSPPTGTDQDRGNSGVYLMQQYEIQILDSYRNQTYPDGQAAAIYGQFAPLVNASRPPGQWQSYDVAFRAPRFDAAGKLLRPARVTLFHNGVLVQDAVELTGPTEHGARPPYRAHPDRLPLLLQDHGHPVRFRNIWIRELAD